MGQSQKKKKIYLTHAHTINHFDKSDKSDKNDLKEPRAPQGSRPYHGSSTSEVAG
jgi:hypothetical protein